MYRAACRGNKVLGNTMAAQVTIAAHPHRSATILEYAMFKYVSFDMYACVIYWSMQENFEPNLIEHGKILLTTVIAKSRTS